jgi:NAD(P)-dependent dehydrogenase (short-subunit alcohol dehydrogenase family)
MISLQGRTALVTGAARGIGEAIASTMGSLGAGLVLVDRDAEALETARAALAERGVTARAFAGDVVEAAFVERVVADVERERGGLDIVVNNAGIIRDGLVERISEADWDAVLAVNLKGAFHLCRAAVPGMKARGAGKIINIVSRAWLGNRGQANYSASKGALVSLTRTLALELAEHNIQVNAVAPGFIDTPMTRALSEAVRARLIALQPGRRAGSVDDVAAAVCFLASDRAGFITGQVLHVDGGKSAGTLDF